MDYDSYDSKKIRKISAHLRQLHLNDYLKSRGFILFCETYDIDSIWEEVIGNYTEQYASGLRRLTNNSYSDSDTDNLFKKFIIKTYFLKKEKFAEIIPEFLSDYSNWSHNYYDLNEPTPVDNHLIKAIGEDLLDMDFGQEDIFMYFRHAGYNLEYVMDLHETNVDQQNSSVPEMSTKKEEKTPNNRKIFIVHGHDHHLKDQVERYLESLDLEPIVLHKQADLGKTIIEKVEHYLASVSFAIILLTGDDIGGEAYVQCDINECGGPISEKDVIDQKKKVDAFKEDLDGEISRYDCYCFFEFASEILRRVNPRSRQNVIFELGITIGHLGRDRVRVLYEEGVELPTDIHGLMYIPLNSDWKKKLSQEIDAAGINIDEKFL